MKVYFNSPIRIVKREGKTYSIAERLTDSTVRDTVRYELCTFGWILLVVELTKKRVSEPIPEESEHVHTLILQ